MADLAKIKRNVAKMVSMDAPETDIDEYISGEGVTIGDVRAFKQSTEEQGGTIEYLASRFNRGMYQMANFPTGLANMAANAIGSDYQFKRPLEAALPGADAAIMDIREPSGAGERVAGTVAEFVGGNALPAVGMLAKAPAIARATANATGLGGQVVNRMAQGVANAPAAAAGGELVSSIGAGLGVETARAVAPDSPGAEMIGGVIGGIGAPLAGAVLPSAHVARAAKKVAGQFSSKAQKTAAQNDLRKFMGEHITPELEAKIAETGDIETLVRNLKLSAAEATESPSLVASQRELEKGMSGANLDRAITRYGDNETAISQASSNLAPHSSLDAPDVVATAGRRVDDLRGGVNRDIAALGVKSRELAGNLTSPESRRSSGAQMREILIDEKSAAKGEASADARRFGLNDTTKKYNFEQIRDGMTDSVEPISKLADPSMRPNQILRDIAELDGNVSINDLTALRSRISDDIRSNLARPDGAKRNQYLEILKGSLDDSVDDVLRNSGDEGLADGLVTFRRNYFDNYVKRFKQGGVGKALKKNTNGEYNIPAENVGREFFKSWNETGAAQFKEILGNHPSANAIMESAAIDDMATFSVVDGVINPAKVAAWANRHKSVLREFPNIQRKISDVQGQVRAMAERQATLVSRQKRIESSTLARELKTVDRATKTPEAMIDAAVLNPVRMSKLAKSLKSPDAKNGLARVVWQRALNQSNPIEFLDANKAAVSMALGPKRTKTAMMLARAISKSKLVPRPSGKSIDTNPLAQVENVLGSGINQISSRVFAVKSGRTSARYAGMDVIGRMVRNMTSNQSRELLERILYDPQAARDLALAIGPGKVTPVTAKRLYTFIATSGVLETSSEDDNAK